MLTGGKVHDVKKDSIMVELTATPHQIRSISGISETSLALKDTARTGVAALQRAGEHEQ